MMLSVQGILPALPPPPPPPPPSQFKPIDKPSLVNLSAVHVGICGCGFLTVRDSGVRQASRADVEGKKAL